MGFVREVSDLANEILDERRKIFYFESLQIAVKIQQNRLFEEAFLLG